MIGSAHHSPSNIYDYYATTSVSCNAKEALPIKAAQSSVATLLTKNSYDYHHLWTLLKKILY